MPDLHILRPHALGLARARKIAIDWAGQVEKEFGLACTYEQGKTADRVQFSRSGVQGALQVTKDKFELDAKLGFLLGAFKDKIEAHVMASLDSRVPADTAPVPVRPAGGKKMLAKKK